MLTWKDGRKYEGPWVLGKQDGIGVFTTSAGKRQRGEWKEGKLVQFFEDTEGAVPANDPSKLLI